MPEGRAAIFLGQRAAGNVTIWAMSEFDRPRLVALCAAVQLSAACGQTEGPTERLTPSRLGTLRVPSAVWVPTARVLPAPVPSPVARLDHADGETKLPYEFARNSSEYGKSCAARELAGLVASRGAGLAFDSNAAPGGSEHDAFDITAVETWTTFVVDSNTLPAGVQGKVNALVSHWANPARNIPSGDRGHYGLDASRRAWRGATDYGSFEEPRAVTYLDNVYDYVEGAGGIGRAQTPSSNYRGASAMSTRQKDAATGQAYTDAWLTTSVGDESYFPGTLRPVYMLLLANQFPTSATEPG